MASRIVCGLVGLGLSVLVGCGGPTDEETEGGTGAQTAKPTTQKKVDDQCFAAYSHAAGKCNETAGDDDAAFENCLTSVKADLASCCANGGSASCAEDAGDTADAQKKVDDECFAAYSHAAGKCNETAGDDDAAFENCLTSVKADLASCCANGGSASCAEDAGDTAAQKKVDDECFAAYSHAAGKCNETAGDDDAAFENCLASVKADLASCCANGGSASCDNP